MLNDSQMDADERKPAPDPEVIISGCVISSLVVAIGVLFYLLISSA